MLKCVLICAITIGLRIISRGQGLTILIPDMFLFIVMRTIVMVMAALPIIGMPPGEIVAVLKKIHAPSYIALPLTFVLRFFPTIKGEFNEVFDSMKLRGILSFKKPMKVLEYTMLPIMIRSTRIAEELAAASETRGISYPGKHTSRRSLKFQRKDYVLCIIGIIITISFLALEKELIG